MKNANAFDKEFFSNPKKPQNRRVTITPELARLWLDKRNKQNRNQSPSNIQLYAQDMKAGRWSLTNQGIGFDWDGQVVDGQNRLEAIVLAGVAVTMYVATGQDPINRLRVDWGGVRTTQHWLQMFTDLDNASIAGKALWAIRRYGLGQRGRQNGEQTIELAKKYHRSLEWVSSACVGGQWGRAPIVGALAFAYPVEPAAVMKANEDLKSGAGLGAKDPILVYRNCFGSNPVNSDAEKIDAFNKLLSAIYHRINGNEITQLKQSIEAVQYFKNGKRGGKRKVQVVFSDEVGNPFDVTRKKIAELEKKPSA